MTDGLSRKRRLHALGSRGIQIRQPIVDGTHRAERLFWAGIFLRKKNRNAGEHQGSGQVISRNSIPQQSFCECVNRSNRIASRNANRLVLELHLQPPKKKISEKNHP
ncbi:MAG: hypothetical protein ACTSY1_00345 [Alphaproteobacteria bacterium]